jgi:iron complex outermembrane receptor protein
VCRHKVTLLSNQTNVINFDGTAKNETKKTSAASVLHIEVIPSESQSAQQAVQQQPTSALILRRKTHVKLKALAQVIPLLFIAPVLAQQQELEKIEITGSSIKRVADEGALPVTVITREDIQRSGFTSAEQLVTSLAASGNGGTNLASQVGIQLSTEGRNNNGNSSADLRGLGASNTLVLLNGRRVALHGAKGYAADLNSIPLGAIDRVEILKDGASSIYGTDAIAGVINFIMRKDYTGIEATAFADITEAGGGNIFRVQALGGWGSLAKDRFNLVAGLTYDEQKALNGSQRSFSNGNQPARGLSTDTTGTPFATHTGRSGSAIGSSFRLPNDTQAYTRANLLAFQGKCDSIAGMAQYEYILNDFAAARYGCTFDTGSTAVLMQPNERINGVLRGTFAFAPNHTATIEAIATKSTAKKTFEAQQLTTAGTLANAWYPVGGPFYQDLSAFIPSFDKTKPIAYRWRCYPCGNREIETVTDSFRLLAALDGTLGRWDYKVGLSTGESKANSTLGGGYYFTDGLIAALASGKLNPWSIDGSQPADGLALLNAASARGEKLFGGKATLVQLDGTVSGEIFKLPAGPIIGALGFDFRQESYVFSDGSTTTRPILNAPFDPSFAKVKRDISAVYAEAIVPIIKGLEANGSVRHDQYSDFGGTTNPKVSLRFQPNNQMLFRGSYGTGFRAPSFFQVYGSTSESQIPGNIADPVLCPKNPNDPVFCAIRPNARQGGNPDLKPETSKQWAIGTVLSPSKDFTATVDFWEIKRKDLIYELTPQQVVANFETFPNNFVRSADGTLLGPGAYIQAGYVNADGDITRGIDVSMQYSMPVARGKLNVSMEGTYIDSHRERVFVTEEYTEFVGQWSTRAIFPRWKHTLGFTYSTGPWVVGLTHRYTHSYKDELPYGPPPPGFVEKVKAYSTFDVSASYTGIKNVTLRAGIKNVADTDPPFTAHNYDFVGGAGWDPRVADPRGRAYVLSASYKF